MIIDWHVIHHDRGSLPEMLRKFEVTIAFAKETRINENDKHLPSDPVSSDAVQPVEAMHTSSSQWSAPVRRFIDAGTYDPDAFEIDRSDLPPIL